MLKVSIKYGLILFIVAAFCSVLVASVFVIVDPVIKERTEQKVKENLNSIYEGINFNFTDVSDIYKVADVPNADALYEIELDGGEIDYVYQLSPEGRNDKIIFLVAYKSDGTIRKLQYVQMRETKGRGDKITLEPYLNMVYSQSADSMDIDMITGATYSSTAMKSSLEASADHIIKEVF